MGVNIGFSAVIILLGISSALIIVIDTKHHSSHDHKSSSKLRGKAAIKPLDDQKFIDEALAEHNKLRAKHGTPPLKLDSTLCPVAVQWAKKQAEDSQKAGKISMTHSKILTIGENIGACKCKAFNGKVISDAWYNEIKYQNWSDNFFNYKTGHFTQLIWKESKTFCIARYTAGNFSSAVAHYQPRGNVYFRSSFAANVLPPK